MHPEVVENLKLSYTILYTVSFHVCLAITLYEFFPMIIMRKSTSVLECWIRRIANTEFVRTACEEKADLSAFREKPTPQVLAGVFAIGFSYVIGWPAVTFLGYLALKMKEPWIAAVGGPLTYGLSHLVFILGMYLSGAVYSMILVRWLTRVSMEKLLAWTNNKA